MHLIENLFRRGMKRELGWLRHPPTQAKRQELPWVDLGASGEFKFGDINLGLPDWEWPRDPIPLPDEGAEFISAYHFLEHLPGEQVITLLEEVQRVLRKGGVFEFVVPYYRSGLMAQDLTHKSSWNEETMRNLLKNNHYDPTAGRTKWSLRVNFMMIAGIVERNLSLFGQLIKG